jgi:protein SCO1
VPSPTPLRLPRSKRTSDSRAGRRAALIAGGALVTAGLVAWLLLRPHPLPVLGTVPPFTLTERSGRAVRAEDLSGHVWVADFVFTRCPDFCPALTARMAGLAKTLAPARRPVRLVSFTVDPAHDTPEVLRAYATRAGAGDGWLFLTGPRDAVSALLRDGFKVAWADDGPPTSPITHSDRFVLVDRALRIRGYYHGTEPADVARLARDATALSDGKTS